MNDKFYIILLFLIGVVACTNYPISSGTDSDNYFKGTVLNNNLHPLTGSHVYLVKSTVAFNQPQNLVVDSTISDSLGEWRFKQREGIYFALSLGNLSYGSALKRLNIKNSIKSPIINPDSLKTIIGHVFVGNEHKVDNSIFVYVMGTNISAQVSNDGSYQLKNVPSGDCDILYIGYTGNYITSIHTEFGKSKIYLKDIALPEVNKNSLPLNEYANCKTVMPLIYSSDQNPSYYDSMIFEGYDYVLYTNNEQTIVTASGSKILPLMNFEYEGLSTLINEEFGKSDLNSLCQIYIYADTNLNTITTKKDSTVLADDMQNKITIRRKPGYWGNSLYTQFIYSNSTTTTNGCVTIFFDKHYNDNSNNNVDISKATSVNFYIKGKGAIKVMLQDSLTIARSGGLLSQYEKIINLGNEWKYYQIPISELTCSPYLDTTSLGLHRNEALKKTEYLKFMTIANPGDTVSFSLDEISVLGVNIEDLR